ncbi:MAG: peptidase C39 family protein [Pseudomonas sp.]|uniref:peptidase C39 family protein n=1 Tax=Pseudomonas sp. TaxID=306 RepID=UPI0030F26EB5
MSVLITKSYLARYLLLLGGLLMLSGCGTTPVDPAVRALPERVELNGVPFFAQTAFESAPGALAIMLSQQDVVTTPGLVAKKMHLPGKESEIPTSFTRVTNDFGLLAYPLQGGLPDLLEQVAAGYPVLVRVNDGFGFVSSPRYAVLVGYDRVKQRMLLRSGMNHRLVVSFADFTSSWNDLGHWALLVQAPAQLPANVDRQRWMAAAKQLELAGQTLAASNAYKAIDDKNR